MKKFLPYILLLAILIGLLSPMGKASAQIFTGQQLGQPSTTGREISQPNTLLTPCTGTDTNGNKIPAGCVGNPPPPSTSALYDSLTTCPPVDGCIARIAYWLFYSIPSFLLGIVANIFDFLISFTLQSDMYTKATFVVSAWTVVRDLSNIFFILILLYVAIQTILGLGHETKKVIVQVIIMALLINFSLFFTKVIIDSSNILALIFYNKINVTIVKDGKTIDTNYIPVLSGGKDKDVAGRMMAYFDPTRILTDDFFKKFRKTEYTFSLKGAAAAAASGALVGTFVPVFGIGSAAGAVVGIVGYTLSGFSNSVPLSISIGFILVAGSIMIFATWCFLVAGLAFLGRMIELWILMIFAPFAFMSWTMPHLLGTMRYIGWRDWISRVVKLSFMAPIFMFFLYLIFLIIQTNIFTSLVDRIDPATQTWMETVIFMAVPALIILILLNKATKYAKEASGELGEFFVKAGKTLTEMAVGGGFGLAASGLQGTLGHAGKLIFENKKLADAEAGGSFWAKRLRSLGGGDDGKGGWAGSSFDVRKGVAGAVLSTVGGATGLNLKNKFLMKEEGGYEADLARRDAKRKKRAEGLKVKEGEEAKQELNRAQEEHKKISLENEHDVHNLDKQITAKEGSVKYLKEVANSHPDKRQDVNGNYLDPQYVEKLEAWSKAANDVKELKAKRSTIKNGGYNEETGEYRTHNGNISRSLVKKIEEEADKSNDEALRAINSITEATSIKDKAIADEAKAVAEAVAANKAAIAVEFGPSKSTPEEIAAAKATAMVATEKAKVATETVKNMEGMVAKTKTNSEKAIKKAAETRERVKAAHEAATKAEASKEGYGHSQNDYEDEIIPEKEHHVKHISDERTRAFADSLYDEDSWTNKNKFVRFFNRADERRKSAHGIRMEVKPEKIKEHDSHIAEMFVADYFGEKLAESGEHGGGDHGDHGGGGGDHGHDAGGHGH